MDRPDVNPTLERALLQHYGAQNRGLMFAFWFCFLLACAVAAWAMITRPDRLWLSTPIVVLGIPSASGAVIFDVLLILIRKRHLVEKLRAGTQIRSVQRGATSVHAELIDGQISTLESENGDELARIEKLLRVQMEMAR